MVMWECRASGEITELDGHRPDGGGGWSSEGESASGDRPVWGRGGSGSNEMEARSGGRTLGFGVDVCREVCVGGACDLGSVDGLGAGGPNREEGGMGVRGWVIPRFQEEGAVLCWN